MTLLVAIACSDAFVAPASRAALGRRPQAKPEARRPQAKAARTTTPKGALPWLGKLALAGAALGPVCDNFHSGFGVLAYDKYEIAIGAAPAWWGDGHLFQTAAWVPPLFAVAALVIGGIDALVAARAPPAAPPSGARAAAGVGAFVALYALSAALAGAPPLGAGVAPATSSLALWPPALALWALLDPSPSSFVAGALTAVGGPLIEVALLGGGGAFAEPFGHLYSYARADLLGVDSWIPAVYFAGGPAVALVSRFLRYN